jgi:hypothetical protein
MLGLLLPPFRGLVKPESIADTQAKRQNFLRAGAEAGLKGILMTQQRLFRQFWCENVSAASVHKKVNATGGAIL